MFISCIVFVAIKATVAQITYISHIVFEAPDSDTTDYQYCTDTEVRWISRAMGFRSNGSGFEMRLKTSLVYNLVGNKKKPEKSQQSVLRREDADERIQDDIVHTMLL
ncbi:hypothetical protein CDAR_80541 [Caerostris darwini]|uniref:Secreted protein n=1 Tax=Caerostris darwini TaxID=1538125 RepID=A0AAV4SMS7_9ARAC|nr:hypothetical protein CDAR_80541 [Caerostris darwini]